MRPSLRFTAGALALAIAGCGTSEGAARATAPESAERAIDPPTATPEATAAPEATAPSLARGSIPDERRPPLPPVRARCARPRADPRVHVEEGIVYSRPGRPLALDLAIPRGPGPHPWVVVFHGGGWRLGQRADVRQEILALAGLGYAAAAVDYRLVGDGARNAFPTAVNDARCAVRFLRREAARFELDPDRAGAIGFSAGGHLAEMLGTAPDAGELDGECADRETSAAVQAVIAYFAPSDLRAPFAGAADRVRDRFLGGPPEQDLARASLASPIVHVDASDPPTLLVHGTADPVVPLAQSRAMRDALSRAGVPVELLELPGVGHGFRLFSRMPGTRPAACASVAFLEAILAHP